MFDLNNEVKEFLDSVPRYKRKDLITSISAYYGPNIEVDRLKQEVKDLKYEVERLENEIDDCEGDCSY